MLRSAPVTTRPWGTESIGKVAYDEFDQEPAKPIVDIIDPALAEHYGFTEESWTSSSSTAWAWGDDLTLPRHDLE